MLNYLVTNLVVHKKCISTVQLSHVQVLTAKIYIRANPILYLFMNSILIFQHEQIYNH